MLIVNKFHTKKALGQALADYGVNSLLSVGTDSKTVKGTKQGYNTAILYMIPDKELCPASKMAGCHEPCLVSAGRGKFNNVKRARLNKTRLFKENKPLFFSALISEIKALYGKHGDTLVIRLNGTSDINYENISFNYNGIEYANIFEYFSYIQFYDYTKRIKRVYSKLPKNYDLTLSYSGAHKNYSSGVLNAVNNGHRIAVVFDDLEQAIKTGWNGYRVTNGDDTDLRFLDKQGIIIGLQAKGQAKKDTSSGFVVQTNVSTNRINVLQVA